jgi:hypothetical protein
MKKINFKYLLRSKYELFKEKYFRKKHLDFICGGDSDPKQRLTDYISTSFSIRDTGEEEVQVFSTKVIGLKEAEHYLKKLEELPEKLTQICLVKPRSKEILRIWHKDSEGKLQCA